ncbi:hypothetical protein SAMN04487911_102189 [Arenibacter nanhaiticus]|uniref:Heavy-metal resistance n=1 Tax=Arenibacter nanhaiticus TaxID=558155 RepID=A0A1M6BGC5_9FLAO|nr:hypothetical protein [Arenibacter nanhaiticus]SHI47771.1 hypothetical protein SAMN04487911_102189 [Arenibacter nanhaiticus]
MDLKRTCLFLTLLASFISLHAQNDCGLGIGISDTNNIIQVFQLNGEQVAKLKEFIAALEVETRGIEEAETTLFEKHPQSTAEELTDLAKKYEALQLQMVAVSRKYDLKVLALLNEKQYDRYISLCKEVSRKPLDFQQE